MKTAKFALKKINEVARVSGGLKSKFGLVPIVSEEGIVSYVLPHEAFNDQNFVTMGTAYTEFNTAVFGKAIPGAADPYQHIIDNFEVTVPDTIIPAIASRFYIYPYMASSAPYLQPYDYPLVLNDTSDLYRQYEISIAFQISWWPGIYYDEDIGAWKYSYYWSIPTLFGGNWPTHITVEHEVYSPTKYPWYMPTSVTSGSWSMVAPGNRGGEAMASSLRARDYLDPLSKWGQPINWPANYYNYMVTGNSTMRFWVKGRPYDYGYILLKYYKNSGYTETSVGCYVNVTNFLFVKSQSGDPGEPYNTSISENYTGIVSP